MMYENIDKKKEEVLKALEKTDLGYDTLVSRVSGKRSEVDEAIDDLLDEGEIEEKDGEFSIAGGSKPDAEEKVTPNGPKGHFCTHCGARLDPGDKFCPKCGKSESHAEAKAECPAREARRAPLGIKLLSLVFAVPAIPLFIGGISNMGTGGIIPVLFSVIFLIEAHKLWRLSKYAYYFALLTYTLPSVVMTIAIISGNAPAPLFIAVAVYLLIARYLYSRRTLFDRP